MTREELKAELAILAKKYADALDRSVVSIGCFHTEVRAAQLTKQYEIPPLQDRIFAIHDLLGSYGKKTFSITTTLDEEVIQLEATSAKDAMEGFLLQLPCWCGTFEATITDGTVETKFTCKLEYKVIQHE
jgi:hypothetical protein